MPRVQTIHTNFTGGEFTPRLRGRVDLQRYANGAKRLFNMHAVVQGGAMSRAGTIFCGAAKFSDRKARLVPFVVNRASSFVLEFADNALRIYKDGAYTGIEIAAPYAGAQLQALDYAQDVDTMYFACQGVHPWRLRRFSDAVWAFEQLPITVYPFDEIGRKPAATLTLDNATVGSGRTVTASSAVFLAGDVGRAIIYRDGIAVLTAVTSATVATVQVRSAFGSTAIPQGWTLDSSPQTGITPSAKEPVGTLIDLTLDAAGWRSDDVGKFVRVNDGLCRITTITSDLIAKATIIKALSSATKAPGLAWSLEGNVWANDYPRTVTLFQQRLIFGGNDAKPQTVWGSRIAEYLDFTRGTNDDEGFAFTISSDENNTVVYLAAGRDLLALTYGAEYSLRGGNEKPITPTNVQVKPESNHGTEQVRPVQIKKEAVFVQRAGRKVRAMGYRYEVDGYNSQDVIALSEHLGRSGFVDMAYQQEPEGLLWAARGDGTLAVCAFDRDSETMAWSPCDVGGAVESMCVIPTGPGEALYMLVRRTVAGTTQRFIERIEPTITRTDAANINGAQTDACVMLSGASSTTWAAPHLTGAAVDVIADGYYAGRFTVGAGGVVTLQDAATSVQIGLPFVAEVIPVTPEVPTGTGTSSGQAKSTSRVVAMLLESGPCRINGNELPMRFFDVDAFDSPPILYSGDVDVSSLGWSKSHADVVVRRELPFPLHVLAVVRDLTVNA